VPDFSGGIVWCYSEISANKQLTGNKHVPFHEVLLADFNNIGEKPCFIILDDLLNSAYSGLFTSYLRNAAIIVISVSF